MVELGLRRLSEVASRVGLNRRNPTLRNGQDVFVHERIEQKPPNALMFDFANIDNEPFLRQQLGNDYLPKARYLVAGALALATSRDKAFEFFLRVNPRGTLAWGAIERFKGHGEAVRNTMMKLRQRLCHNDDDSLPYMFPLQDVIRLEFKRDELGNHGVAAHFDIDEMNNLLNQRTEQFVNISFQSGAEIYAHQFMLDAQTNRRTAVSPPRIVIKGAYVPENAERNLRRVSWLPLAYPEKVFFLAGGNHGDNPTYVFAEHPDILPDNALLVGEWIEDGEEAGPANNVYGLQLYVPNKGFTALDGSSQSTGMVMELCNQYARRNSLEHNPKAAVEAIINLCAEDRVYKAPQIDRETNLPVPGAFELLHTRVLSPRLVDEVMTVA